MPEKIKKNVSGTVAEKKVQKPVKSKTTKSVAVKPITKTTTKTKPKTVKAVATKPKAEKTSTAKAKPVKVVKPKVKTTKTATKKAVKKEIELKDSIIDGIKEKNGGEIVVIDFKKINNSLCDYFIVCQGASGRQVEAIAEGIEDSVRKQLGQKPYHREGFENAQWILLDYIDIIVHIFQPETRNFYQIESLWADADVTNVK